MIRSKHCRASKAQAFPHKLLAILSRSAALLASLRQSGRNFLLFTRHLFLSAQARLGNVTGLLSDVPSGTGTNSSSAKDANAERVQVATLMNVPELYT